MSPRARRGMTAQLYLWGVAQLGDHQPSNVARLPYSSVPVTSPVVRADDYLPHRDPFLFVTDLRSVEPGQSATGAWKLTGEEAFFAGHFPGRPTLPGVLMAVLADPARAGKLPLFGGIERARFRRQVVPGDLLELEVTLGRMSARAGKGSGRATVDGQLACEVDLLFVLVDASPDTGQSEG